MLDDVKIDRIFRVCGPIRLSLENDNNAKGAVLQKNCQWQNNAFTHTNSLKNFLDKAGNQETFDEFIEE